MLNISHIIWRLREYDKKEEVRIYGINDPIMTIKKPKDGGGGGIRQIDNADVLALQFQDKQ